MTRVVKPGELGRPDESLREQMWKLILSPQGKYITPTVSAALPCVVGMQFTSFPSLLVKTVAIDIVLYRPYIALCRALLLFLHQM